MSNTHRLRPFGSALLVALAVLAVVVSVMAVRHARPEQPAVGSLDSPGADGSTGTPTPSGSAAATGAPSGSSTAISPAPAGFRTLVAVNGDVAWRTSSGTCAAGGATVEVSADAGKTWRAVSTKLDRLVRVQPTSAQEAFIVGSSASACGLSVETTQDAGANWSGPQSVGEAFARDLASAATLHVPGNGTTTPCGANAIADFARVDTARVVVLCVDGAIRSSTDAGVNFSDAGKVSGARAVAVDGERIFAFASSGGDCSGIEVSQVGGQVRSCLSEARGPVAAAVTPDGAWLWVGASIYRSTDDLASWQKAN